LLFSLPTVWYDKLSIFVVIKVVRFSSFVYEQEDQKDEGILPSLALRIYTTDMAIGSTKHSPLTFYVNAMFSHGARKLIKAQNLHDKLICAVLAHTDEHKLCFIHFT
jgi:hypothetical protein